MNKTETVHKLEVYYIDPRQKRKSAVADSWEYRNPRLTESRYILKDDDLSEEAFWGKIRRWLKNFRCKYKNRHPFAIWPERKCLSTDFAEGEAGATFIKEPNVLLTYALLQPNETWRASVDVDGSLEKLARTSDWETFSKKKKKSVLEKTRDYYELDSYCLIVAAKPDWAYTVLFRTLRPTDELPPEVWNSFRNPKSRDWIR